jgi:Ala-tRNA(Pro) deacylase
MSLAQTLESYLSDRGVRYTVERHSASTTSLGTARKACVDEASLAKSVVLEDDRGFVLAVLPASRMLEIGRVRNKLGRPLHLSCEFEMVRLFPDCALGAVPPLGAAYGLPTLVDAHFDECDEIFFEGGDHETLVRMDGGEFLGLLATAFVGEITSERTPLAAAIELKERLYDSLISVRRAVGAPIASGTHWRERLRRELLGLARAADDHVRDTEATDGLLAEIVEEAPRLWREAEGLRAEHESLTKECGRMLERIDGIDSPLSLRSRANDLLGRFERHRYRGADLVYEAFDVDIGGG